MKKVASIRHPDRDIKGICFSNDGKMLAGYTITNAQVPSGDSTTETTILFWSNEKFTVGFFVYNPNDFRSSSAAQK